MRWAFLFPILGAAALGGCATDVEGTRESIYIETTPEAGAVCVVPNGESRALVTTPGIVDVERSYKDLPIHCSRPGYRDAYASIPKELEPWTVANVVTGGLGFGVDTLTGAANRLPPAYAVAMTPVPGYVPPVVIPTWAGPGAGVAGVRSLPGTMPVEGVPSYLPAAAAAPVPASGAVLPGTMPPVSGSDLPPPATAAGPPPVPAPASAKPLPGTMPPVGG